MQSWWIFIKERFEPISHFVMLLALYSANSGLALRLTGTHSHGAMIVSVFILELLFFFHLRLFDELKDYATDLSVNQTRPLPRGLIAIPEFKRGLWMVISFEILLVLALGWVQSSWVGIAAYACALAYSLLMYREFFIGDWLRPKMELYAISHTFVAGIFALAVGFNLAGFKFFELSILSRIEILFLNWMVFNVFEFARKTFSSNEERPAVESYSKRLGPKGASFVVLIFVFLAYFSANLISERAELSINLRIGVAASSLVVAVSGLIYSLWPNYSYSGKTFRATSSFYLVVFNACIGIAAWLGIS